MKLKDTVWEVLALFPWMVIISAIVIHLTLGLAPIASLSLLGLVIYIFIAVALFAIWIIFIAHALIKRRFEWALIIFIFSLFAYPVYWWKYIRYPVQQYTDVMFAGEAGSLQKELAELALVVAKEFYGKNLDFSHKSIHVVESILAHTHEACKKSGNADGLKGIAFEFGAYIAATIQKNTGSGELAKDHPDLGDDTFPFYWKGSVLFTCTWCEKRIFDGAEDDIVSKYRVLVLDKI